MTWNELSQATIDDVLAWAGGEPWGCAMAECRQDAQWHAEGDVWTHTKMVCMELPGLDEWGTLSTEEQTILLFAALLHDCGKPRTSQVDQDTGRIRSHKHAVKGEYLARGVLRELGCDLATREEIARLVRFHVRPAFLLEKPDPTREVVSLSWLVNNKLLFLLALSDTRGRDADEMSRPEENIHYWRLAAEENGCFERPYLFANDHARFTFFRQPKPDLHYVPYEDFRSTVTVMSGLPGSGKDTWLAGSRTELPVVSLDDIREELKVEATENQGKVVQLARVRCRELLRWGEYFAFNATNLRRQTRRRWVDLFADYNARIELVYIEPPLSVVLGRNRRRARAVPEDVIRELAGKTDPPTWTEAHTLAIIDK